jgi:hypothetical protein
MRENRMMEQINAVFGAFMTLFYIGIGLFVAFSDRFNLDKVVTGIFGFSFILYGVYRGFRSIGQIREAFFMPPTDEEE